MWICTSCKAENPDSITSCQSCSTTKVTGSATSRPTFYTKVSEKKSNSPIISTLSPTRQIDNYISRNTTSSLLNIIGTVYIVIGIIGAIIGFFVVGNLLADRYIVQKFVEKSDFNFWYALATFFVIVGASLLPGLLLKALASIVQNSQNTVGYIQYKIDTDQDAREANI